jgi:hypothetical protein
MSKKLPPPANLSLLDKVYSEGYCCMYGYLTLCEARGETPKQMGENLSVLPHTIRHHYRCLRKGERSCENKPDCLGPVIAEIKNEG